MLKHVLTRVIRVVDRVVKQTILRLLEARGTINHTDLEEPHSNI